MRPKELTGVILILVFFIAGSIVAYMYQDVIASYLDFGVWGMLAYFAIEIFSTVAAPVSTMPLIPIAVALWGPYSTAILSILAWLVGAMIAFAIARHWGRPIVSRFVDMGAISKYEKLLGEKSFFWNIVLLRMAIPVDILSYAIGLFTTMKMGPYAIATFLGTIPFAFIFAYLPSMPILLQVAAIILVGIVFWIGYRKLSGRNP